MVRVFRSVLLLAMLVMTSYVYGQSIDWRFQDASLPLDTRVEILVSQMTTEEKLTQLVNDAVAIDRLGVPEYEWWNEALHGVARNGKATVFPQIIGLAATFDPELVERMADAISTEARAKYNVSSAMGNRGRYAGLTFWSPNINIFRDPRWGRGQETFGEDPYLTSVLGSAFVRGMQGDDPNYLKTTACAKHFAVHSGPEADRMTFNVSPSKQDLYETYLPAFELLVTEANVEGVMAAYNAVNDVPANASDYLLKDILRDQWNFDGYIVSDCGAIGRIASEHGFVDSEVEAAAAAFKAGVNLNCGGTYNKLNQALAQGLVTEELIHLRAKELFRTRFRLGLFDESSTNPFNQYGETLIHSNEHVALAREVARKSIVLLKNKDNTLPLSKDVKVPYVTGPFANSVDMLMGNYYGISSNFVTVLEGIADALSIGSSLNYRKGVLPFHDNLNELNYAPFVASLSDVTICVVGLSADREGEQVDAIAAEHHGDKIDLSLPQNQVNYVKELIKHKKGPLVLVIASGSPVSLEDIEEHCDAILQIWYPGEQGGNAVADVLFGDYSPSGHLPITFPKNEEQLPPYEDYAMQGRTYKYMSDEPLYPFGFGLTYSSVKFSELTTAKSLNQEDTLQLEVSISNEGSYDIDEVIQLYVSPMDTVDGMPNTSLKAFRRVSLMSGETKRLNFQLSPDQLLVVNTQGKRVWRLGKYKLIVGNSSPGSRSISLGAATPLEQVITLR